MSEKREPFDPNDVNDAITDECRHAVIKKTLDLFDQARAPLPDIMAASLTGHLCGIIDLILQSSNHSPETLREVLHRDLDRAFDLMVASRAAAAVEEAITETIQ